MGLTLLFQVGGVQCTCMLDLLQHTHIKTSLVFCTVCLCMQRKFFFPEIRSLCGGTAKDTNRHGFEVATAEPLLHGEVCVCVHVFHCPYTILVE